MRGWIGPGLICLACHLLAGVMPLHAGSEEESAPGVSGAGEETVEEGEEENDGGGSSDGVEERGQEQVEAAGSEAGEGGGDGEADGADGAEEGGGTMEGEGEAGEGEAGEGGEGGIEGPPVVIELSPEDRELIEAARLAREALEAGLLEAGAGEPQKPEAPEEVVRRLVGAFVAEGFQSRPEVWQDVVAPGVTQRIPIFFFGGVEYRFLITGEEDMGGLSVILVDGEGKAVPHQSNFGPGVRAATVLPEKIGVYELRLRLADGQRARRFAVGLVFR